MPTDPTTSPPPDAAAPQGDQKLARRRATLRFMFSHPVHIVSLGFGSGLAPILPGTFGTLFGWISFYLLNHYLHLSATQWWVLIVAGFALGCPMTGFTARKMAIDDPGPAVWDEIVAIWLVFVFIMPAGFVGQLVAFVLFRFFDMVKPPPIRYFDRNLHGGFGIMFDDIVAAVMTLFVIALWRSFV